MANIDEEKLDLIKNIKEMKNGSIEQMWLITIYCLESYFKSLFTFGRNNRVTRDNINIIKEMFAILQLERRFLNYINHNIDSFDIDSCQDVVFLLDSINDKTVEYYYDLINDIEDAAELNQEHRGYRPRSPFPSLINDDSYAIQVIALSETLSTIRSFLGYEEEFWIYIEKRVLTEEERVPGAYPEIDENNIITGVKIALPKVTNLDSSLLAIEIYKEAYELYKMIKKPYSKETMESSTDILEEYKTVYLPAKAKKTLKYKM